MENSHHNAMSYGTYWEEKGKVQQMFYITCVTTLISSSANSAAYIWKFRGWERSESLLCSFRLFGAFCGWNSSLWQWINKEIVDNFIVSIVDLVWQNINERFVYGSVVSWFMIVSWVDAGDKNSNLNGRKREGKLNVQWTFFKCCYCFPSSLNSRA